MSQPKDQASNADRAIRTDLAAAMRAAVLCNLHEGIDTHFTALSAAGDSYFLNPFGLHWSEVRAGDMLEIGLDRTVRAGSGHPDETAVAIHTGLHAAGWRCVLHSHMPHATALTQLETMELEPCGQNAIALIEQVAYDRSYHGLALDPDEGARLARLLGERSILFMANHGVIVCGNSIGDAFRDLYVLERACTTQLLAMATGQPRRMVDPHIIRETARQVREASDFHQQSAGDLHLAAMKRVLDRRDPHYRD